jgi:hypothetical protein
MYIREPRESRYSRPVSMGKARDPQFKSLGAILTEKYWFFL